MGERWRERLPRGNAARAAPSGSLSSTPPPLLCPSCSDLRIGVKYKPEKCTVTSKNGDKLEMHYTGTLYKDGCAFPLKQRHLRAPALPLSRSGTCAHARDRLHS